MTLEQMLATPSVVAALVVVAVVVFVVAFLLGRRRGFQDVQDGVDPNDPSLFGAAKNASLFGPRVPVQSTERQLVAVMPEALVVVDSLATVQYASPAARRFGIIHDQAMALAEIRDIVKLVSTDSVVRERELTIPLHFGLLTIDAVLDALNRRHPAVEVVVTGRYAPQELIDAADLVTEMREIKHYYTQGVLSRDGIDR